MLRYAKQSLRGQTAQTALVAGWLGMSVAPMTAWAAASTKADAQSQAIAFGLTALVAALVGLLLYRLSRRVGRTGYVEEARKIQKAKQAAMVLDRKQLLPVIVQEVNKLGGTTRQREAVARTVSDLVTQTINEEVDMAKEEVTTRHTKVIEEQRRHEAILQRKYKSTLSDKKQTTAVLESIAEGLVVVNNTLSYKMI